MLPLRQSASEDQGPRGGAQAQKTEMPEQAHEIVTEQGLPGPMFEPAHGPMFEQAHVETDQLEETREHVRAALYEKLLSLDPKQVREMLANHVRGCTAPSCPTCCRIRERAALRKQQRQAASEKRLRLWRGVAKSIGPMLALRVRAAQNTYAPGGTGYHAARSSFERAQSHQSGED